jgi:hypothetical protein
MLKVEEMAERHAAAGAYDPLALFSKRQFEVAAAAALSARPYYDSRRGLFWFAYLTAFACQAASAASSWRYVEGLLAVKLSGPALVAATAAGLLLVECAKFHVFKALFADLFRLSGPKLGLGLAGAALAVSAVSVWASVQGGGSLAVDPRAVGRAAAPHQSEVAALRSEIADIQRRNTWKGSTYIAGADKKLLHQKEGQLAAAMAGRDGATEAAQEKERAAVDAYRYAFGGFEALFLLCTLFVWHFRKRVAVEAGSGPPPPTVDGERNTVNVGAVAVPGPRPARSIGFTFGWQRQGPGGTVNVGTVNVGKEKACEHCGAAFVKKHWNARYCSDACRVAAWEKRTGKTFNRPKKTG